MATNTLNYNIVKPDLTDIADIAVINSNMDIVDTELKAVNNRIDKQSTIYTATGSANTYSITIAGVTGYNAIIGLPIIIKINADSTAASTININSLGAKSIKKPNGNNVTNFKANGLYTLVYDGLNFQLQGEGGEYGTAGTGQVLTGYTIGTDSGIISGAMANNGATSQSLAINGSYTIPAGYHNGSGKVTQAIATKAAAIYNPSTSPQAIAAGQYLSGDQTINPVTGTATVADVVSGKTFASANGIGLTGTNTNKKWASSTNVWVSNSKLSFTSAYNVEANWAYIEVSGLNFTPSFIEIQMVHSTTKSKSLYTNFDVFYVSPVSNYMVNINTGSSSTPMQVTGNAYVTSSGFRLPVQYEAVFYNWRAIE